MHHVAFYLAIIVATECIHSVASTIDVDTSQFEYIANHLTMDECRKLVASLHFDTFYLPNPLEQAERKVPIDLTCFQQLVHWNGEPLHGGHGKTHEFITRRLKQLNRPDLALWLAHSAFAALDHHLLRNVDNLQMFEPIRLPYINLRRTGKPTKASAHAVLRITTPESVVRVIKQDAPPSNPVEDILVDPTEWTIFDTISWTIVVMLFLLVIVLVVYLTLASPCCTQRRLFLGLTGRNRPQTPQAQTQAMALTQPAARPMAPVSPQVMYDCYRSTMSPMSRMCEYTSSPSGTLPSVRSKALCPYSAPPAHQCQRERYEHHHYECPKCHLHKRDYCPKEYSYKSRAVSKERHYPCQLDGGLPPPPRPLCTCAGCPINVDYASDQGAVYNNLTRTIDIHQKIAIPVQGVDISS